MMMRRRKAKILDSHLIQVFNYNTFRFADCDQYDINDLIYSKQKEERRVIIIEYDLIFEEEVIIIIPFYSTYLNIFRAFPCPLIMPIDMG